MQDIRSSKTGTLSTAAVGERNAFRERGRVRVQRKTETATTSTQAANAAIRPGTALHLFLQEPPKFSRRGGQGTTKEDRNQTNPKTRGLLITPRPHHTPAIFSNSPTWIFYQTTIPTLFLPSPLNFPT